MTTSHDRIVKRSVMTSPADTDTPAATTSSYEMTRGRAGRKLAKACRLINHDKSQSEKSCSSSYQRPQEGSTAVERLKFSRTLSRGPPMAAINSSEFYLQQSGVQFYLEDLVRKLQELEPDAPAAFIVAYFENIVSGRNVEQQTFHYINATMHNRLAFIALLANAYADIDQQLQLTSEDFKQVVWWHCRDFPVQLLQQASAHLKEIETAECTESLESFIKAFRVCFLYNEYLCKSFDAYSDHYGQEATALLSPKANDAPEGINQTHVANHILPRLRAIAQQSSILTPPMEAVEAAAMMSSTFKEFSTLLHNDTVVQSSVDELLASMKRLEESYFSRSH